MRKDCASSTVQKLEATCLIVLHNSMCQTLAPHERLLFMSIFNNDYDSNDNSYSTTLLVVTEQDSWIFILRTIEH